VPNWSISRNYKEIWNSSKISVTPGMHLTRGGRVQKPLMCGPSGWPVGQTPWPTSPALQSLVSFLGGDVLQEAVEWNSRLGVGGGHDPWPVDQRSVNHRCNQVGNCSWDSYKYPHADGIHTPHSTCSSPLVKVSV
jgi:hypothetical protein